MIRLGRAALAGAALAVSLAAGGAAAQEDWGLARLMQSMAQVKSANASFTESKTIKMLKAPLQTSGSLAYVAPDYIRKTTTAPLKEDFVLRQGVITLTDAKNETHRFPLTQAPGIGGLAIAIQGTLSGNLPELQQNFGLTLSGSAVNWQLVLQPRDPSLKAFVAWIAIHGVGNRINEIDTEGADGGASRMHVSEDQAVAR